MKYCKDCKHLSPKHHIAYCAHPSIGPADLVYGEPSAEPCFVLRSETNIGSFYAAKGRCGPEAVLFEPKPQQVSLFKRILNEIFQNPRRP